MVSSAEPFDRALRRHRHARAAAGFAEAGFLHAAMAAEVRDRAEAETAVDVLDLGGPAPVWPGAVRLALAAPASVVADEDRLPFADASFDLVVSVAGLASVGDLPGALIQARRVLRPGGRLVAAFAGGMTLADVRSDFIAAEAEIAGGAAARTHPMVDASAAAGLLQRAGFADPVAAVERLTVRYPSLAALFADLTAMGGRSVLASRAPLRRDVLAAAAARFAARAHADGKTGVMVDILHLAGRAPSAMTAASHPKAPIP